MPWSQVELLPSFPGFPQRKHDQVQKKLELVEKQLEEAQQLVQLREMKISGSGGGRGVPSGAMHALGIQPDLRSQHGHPSGAAKPLAMGRVLPPLLQAALLLQPLATPVCFWHPVTLYCSSGGSWQ